MNKGSQEKQGCILSEVGVIAVSALNPFTSSRLFIVSPPQTSVSTASLPVDAIHFLPPPSSVLSILMNVISNILVLCLCTLTLMVLCSGSV